MKTVCDVLSPTLSIDSFVDSKKVSLKLENKKAIDHVM